MKSNKLIFFILGFIFIGACWQLFVKKYLWQQIYAAPASQTLTEEIIAERIDLLPDQPWQNVTINKQPIKIKFRAEHEICARIGAIDIYDDSFHIGFQSEQSKLNDFYNNVSPLDITLIVGDTAAEGNWQKIKMKHEYRVILYSWQYADHPIVHKNEISNSHIIPATTAVRRGFDTLKTGDIICLKGYLVDWSGIHHKTEINFNTALTPGEIADFYLGGQDSGLCRQFYVTRLIADDHVYQ